MNWYLFSQLVYYFTNYLKIMFGSYLIVLKKTLNKPPMTQFYLLNPFQKLVLNENT